MNELKVPYALDETGVVTAALTANQKGKFTCLDCSQPLSLRRRRGHRPHFTHHGHALRNCSGESVTHQAAKLLLREQVEQELLEQQQITWHLKCAGVDEGCGDRVTFRQQQPLPVWDAVELEVGHGPYRLDVAVTHSGQVIFGFEVYFRHEVPHEKAEALDVPWLELRAEDILAYRPRLPHRNRFAKNRCPACTDLAARQADRAGDNQARQQVEAEFKAEAERVTRTWNAILRTARNQPDQARGKRRQYNG